MSTPTFLLPALPFLLAAAVQVIAGLCRNLVGATTNVYLEGLETFDTPVNTPGVPDGEQLPRYKIKDLLPKEYEYAALTALFGRQGEAVTALVNVPVLILPLISAGTFQASLATLSIVGCLIASFACAAWMLRMPIEDYQKRKEKRLNKLGVMTPWLVGTNLALGILAVLAGLSLATTPAPAPSGTP